MEVSFRSTIKCWPCTSSTSPAFFDYRIRLVILRHIPLLAEQLGKNFVGDNLTPVCVRLLEDDISSIREAAARNLAVRTQISFC